MKLQGARGLGFTIVEVMIFLSVSSVLLIMTMAMFSGLQARNEFALSARDAEIFFQDVINDVSTGYFDELKGYSCTGPGTGIPTFAKFSGSEEQGTDKGCIFFGKAILVKPDSGEIEIFPVVANRLNSVSLNVSYYNEAYPTTVYQENVAPGEILDQFSTYTLRYGVIIKSAKMTNPQSTKQLAGIYSNLSHSGGQTGTGAKSLEFYAYQPTSIAHQAIKLCIPDTPSDNCAQSRTILGSNKTWELCLWSDSSGSQQAKLSIVGGDTLTTKLEMGTACS